MVDVFFLGPLERATHDKLLDRPAEGRKHHLEHGIAHDEGRHQDVEADFFVPIGWARNEIRAFGPDGDQRGGDEHASDISAGIPQVDLGGAPVEPQERHHGPDGRRPDHAGDGAAHQVNDEPQTSERDDGDDRGQAIHAIHEVETVDDRHDPQGRKRHGDPKAHLDHGETGDMEILEPEPKDGEQKRDDKLPEELLARFEVFEVVHKAEDARRQGREEDKGEFLEGNAVTQGLEAENDETDEHRQGDGHIDGHPTQLGDCLRMDLTMPWMVDDAVFVGSFDGQRDKDKPKAKGHKEDEVLDLPNVHGGSFRVKRLPI